VGKQEQSAPMGLMGLRMGKGMCQVLGRVAGVLEGCGVGDVNERRTMYTKNVGERCMHKHTTHHTKAHSAGTHSKGTHSRCTQREHGKHKRLAHWHIGTGDPPRPLLRRRSLLGGLRLYPRVASDQSTFEAWA